MNEIFIVKKKLKVRTYLMVCFDCFRTMNGTLTMELCIKDDLQIYIYVTINEVIAKNSCFFRRVHKRISEFW